MSTGRKASETRAASRVPRLDFELTAACDHRCAHCYNVWRSSEARPGAASRYPVAALDGDAYLAMMTKAVRESGARHITLTGGEPLLRPDALAVVAHACALVPSVQLITNGGHLGPDVARRLGELGVRAVQLTLLSADRDRHDGLKGAPSFDGTVRAALDLRDAGVGVQVCFVATSATRGELAEVLELCAVLGVRNVSYNRMAPAGWAAADAERLLPTPAQVEEDLATAERLGRRLGLRIATAMPIPPCVVRLARYPSVRFAFCSVGSGSPNTTIDPVGNVRTCNLSSRILGNIRDQPWEAIFPGAAVADFRRAVPEPCRGCAYERSCGGGCKESGAATWGRGRLDDLDPFVELARRAASPPAAEP